MPIEKKNKSKKKKTDNIITEIKSSSSKTKNIDNKDKCPHSIKFEKRISNTVKPDLLSHIQKINEELKKITKYDFIQEVIVEETLKIRNFKQQTQTEKQLGIDLKKLILNGINETKNGNTLTNQKTKEIINPKRAEILEYPVDKINSKVWTILKENNKIDITFAAEKRNSRDKLNIYYSIDFEKISENITSIKKLLPFDKRIYISISSLFNANNSIVTLTQIYYAMGYTGKPGTSDLKKINESILKMLKATISINNEQEAKVYKKYGKFIYRGSLLPVETSEYHNFKGKFTDAAIHIFREPPLISFAKQRKQVTTINIKLLQSPISKTNTNLMIDDYLIERIARSKNNKTSHKILYETLYKKIGITTKKQRQRTPEKIAKYLEHYKRCGSIERYKIEETGPIIYFNK